VTPENCRECGKPKCPRGLDLCRRCSEEMDEDNMIHNLLDECDNLDELKDFIRENLLPAKRY